MPALVKLLLNFSNLLFFAHEHHHRGTAEIPVPADFVLQIAAVRLLYPLRQVAEEDESRHLGALELSHIFDFHILSLVGRWGIAPMASCITLLSCEVDTSRRRFL